MSVFFIVIGYLAITLIIGNVLTKKSQDVDSFFVAKNQLGTLGIICLVFGELISGSSTIGNAASAFSMGISAVWTNIGMCLGGLLFALVFCKFYVCLGKVEGVGTIPEAYGWYFSQRCRHVMTFTIVLMYFVLQGLLPKSAAAVLAPMLGLDETFVVWSMCAIFILLALMGGLKSIANMNVLHSFVMYFGLLIVAILALGRTGGLSTLTANLPASYFSFSQPSGSTIFAKVLGSMLSLTAAPLVVNDVLGAKKFHHAKWGVAIGSLLMIPFAFFPAAIGMCAKVLLPEIPDNSALYLMSAELGLTWSVVASMAVLAAILSTAPGGMLVIANSLTVDIYRPFLRKNASEKECMLFSRVCMVLIGVTSCWLGQTTPEIMSQFSGALQIKSVAGAVLLIALFWHRVNERAAFWGMLVGGVVAAGWFFAGNPFGVEPLWPACGAGLGLLVILTLLSSEKESPSWQNYHRAVIQFQRDEYHNKNQSGGIEGCPSHK